MAMHLVPSDTLRAPAAQRGQASVDLVAALPLVVLVALVAWQLVLAGHAMWLVAHAARAAARADAVGRSPRSAARSAVPRSLEHGLVVRRMRDGGVRVSLRIPLLVPAWRTPVSVGATSSLGRARGG